MIEVISGTLTSVSDGRRFTKKHELSFLEFHNGERIENVTLPNNVADIMELGEECYFAYYTQGKKHMVCAAKVGGKICDKTPSYPLDEMYKSAFHSFGAIIFLYALLIFIAPGFISSGYFESIIQPLAVIGLLGWPFFRFITYRTIAAKVKSRLMEVLKS